VARAGRGTARTPVDHVPLEEVSMKLSVLGMGRMGQAIAGSLLDADHEVTIWNRSSGKAPDLVRGARR